MPDTLDTYQETGKVMGVRQAGTNQGDEMTKLGIDDAQVQADTIRHMVRQEAKRIAAGKSNWPGLPLSHIPSLWDSSLRLMENSGEVERVRIPRPNRPGKTVTYIRFTK